MGAAARVTSETETRNPPVSRIWLLLFGLAWFGFWLLVMLPGQFMVVKFASVVAPEEKVAVGSFLIAEMTIFIVVGVPLFGWLCDRTDNAFGRRRTWALAGAIVATVAFSLVGLQTSWQAAAALLALVALGQSAILVSLSAIIADRVPVAQRGRASMAMGIPQVIALAGGMILVTEVITEVGPSWMVIALLAFLAPLPFIFCYREPKSAVFEARPRQSFHEWRELLASGRYRDFGWAGLSRVLVNAGNLIGTTYLLFFLSDALKMPNPDGSLTTLILVYLVASALASWVGGALTDKWRVRRPLVALCAGLQVAAALLLAFVPTWESCIVAAVLLGLGYGAFLAVDQALLTDLLPDERTRARDLGIVNSAQHLPVAPLVGWLILSVAGYTELYVIAAVIMALGGLFVLRIRSVR